MDLFSDLFYSPTETVEFWIFKLIMVTVLFVCIIFFILIKIRNSRRKLIEQEFQDTFATNQLKHHIKNNASKSFFIDQHET